MMRKRTHHPIQMWLKGRSPQNWEGELVLFGFMGGVVLLAYFLS